MRLPGRSVPKNIRKSSRVAKVGPARGSPKRWFLFLTVDYLILVRCFQVCNSWIVNTVASCGRLPATVPDLANRPRQVISRHSFSALLFDVCTSFSPSSSGFWSSAAGSRQDKDVSARRRIGVSARLERERFHRHEAYISEASRFVGEASRFASYNYNKNRAKRDALLTHLPPSTNPARTEASMSW